MSEINEDTQPAQTPHTTEEVEALREEAVKANVPFIDPRMGEKARSAFQYAQALILLFDSHTNEAFEEKREELMTFLTEFATEFVVLASHLEETEKLLPSE